MPTSAAHRRYDWFVERVLDGTLDDDAVAEGFAPSFVEKLSAARVIDMGRNLGALLRAPVVETTETGSTIVVEYASMAATADVEPSPPHRFVRLHFGPLRVDDPRLKAATWSVEGDADTDFDKTKSFFEENSLVGIVVAGFEGGEPTPSWRIAGGY